MTWSDVTSILHKCHFARSKKRPSQRTIMAQWFWMRAWFTEEAAFKEFNTSDSPYGSKQAKLVSQAALEEKARALGIKIIARAPENQTSSSSPQKSHGIIKRKRGISGPVVDTVDQGANSDFSDAETDFLPITPKKLCQRPVPKTPTHPTPTMRESGLLTPPSTSSRKHQPILQGFKRLPRIAFRAFSDASQGVNSIEGFSAGSFIDHDSFNISPPPPPRTTDPVYLSEAARHVHKDHTGPTPFISLSRNLLRCLHRAVETGPNSSIVSFIRTPVIPSRPFRKSQDIPQERFTFRTYLPTLSPSRESNADSIFRRSSI